MRPVMLQDAGCDSMQAERNIWVFHRPEADIVLLMVRAAEFMLIMAVVTTSKVCRWLTEVGFQQVFKMPA